MPLQRFPSFRQRIGEAVANVTCHPRLKQRVCRRSRPLAKDAGSLHVARLFLQPYPAHYRDRIRMVQHDTGRALTLYSPYRHKVNPIAPQRRSDWPLACQP
jgi:hypothetical protein